MSDIIEITSSDDEDNAEKAPRPTKSTTNNTISTTTMMNVRTISGTQKRPSSNEQSPVKKRIKPNHVSPHVTHPAFQKQNVKGRSTLGETVMVYDPKAKHVVYQKMPVISDVRSISDPLDITQSPKTPSKPPVMLPSLSEVAIIPLKSPQSTAKKDDNKIPSIPMATVPSTSGQNGYTSTPDITIRTVPRITSPVPGSSRTSSMSSPASSTSVNNITEVPKVEKNIQPPLEMNQAFKDLLEVCKSTEQSKEMDLITKKLVKYYRGVHADFVNSISFKRSVEKATNDIKSQPAQVFWLLKTIVDELKIRQGASKVTEDGEIVTENAEIVTTGDPKTDKKLYKLNKCLYVTQKRIEKLQQQDAMWEEENNSAYMMIARYEKRAVQIYEKICELTGESTNANRRVKKPIKFNKTKYTEFNKALQTFYNKTHNFPDFHDVLKVLEYCNTQYDYGLRGDLLKIVAQEAFQDLGEELQNRRKLDAYESLTYLSSLGVDDPANHDPDLARKLEENKKYHTRIDDVIKKYAEGRLKEANELIKFSMKQERLSNHNSDDSGNDEGDNPPELLNGSNPATPQSTNNNDTSTNIDQEKPKTFRENSPSPSISDTTEIELEPDLLNLDDVALFNCASSLVEATDS